MAKTKAYARAALTRVRDAAAFTPWEQTEPSVVHYTNKMSKENIHVVVAFVVKFAPDGVSKIKYGAVVTRYQNKLPVSPNNLRKTAESRLANDPVTCKFSVPIPFTEKAVGAYVRNQIYRKGVSGEYARRKNAEQQQQPLQQPPVIHLTVADASQPLAISIGCN
jgi:hypothetical protein